ncbi:MAG: LysM peptidoglycan-binding domain-containing protein [Candidatus Electrothrix sp. GM3_4]|nr:LysM peptidoglycan-binding domain-containing protein [Candidatus Electrothrix sp. GM3_4]
MIKKITCLLLFFATFLLVDGRCEAGSRFPIYQIIAPNVQFWEKIYGTYTSNQGVLHDKKDLSIIYAVIDFAPRRMPGASRVNAQLEKVVRMRHEKMLEKFADGKKPSTKEEKKVYALFKGRQRPAVFREAGENMRLQTGLKNTFRKGVIRSGAYMPLIKKIIRARNLPVELAYLPHVESSFNLKAHSKAAAVGLWQFTKYTGREYMTINELVDERFDVYLSSMAAAQFLKENYRQLGSWPSALTAYNYGRAGMVRAQKKWGTYPEIIANHQTGIFKFASKNFYSEFIAAVRVARRLENDRSLVKDRPWINVTFRLHGYAPATELRKYFGISDEEFKRLNPAIRDAVLAGRKYIPKGTLVRLPATKRIRKQIKNIPSRLLYAQQVRDKEYKVKKGDTALSIAKKYKVSLKELVQANNLGRKAKIRRGKKLRIPSPAAAVKTTTRRDAMVTLQATSKEEVKQQGKLVRKEVRGSKTTKDVPLALADSDNSNSILTLNKISKRTP